MSEADYAHLITAAHRALGAPLIVIWDNLNTHRSKKMRAFTEAREDWLTVVSGLRKGGSDMPARPHDSDLHRQRTPSSFGPYGGGPVSRAC
jgi:hypothetical protein